MVHGNLRHPQCQGFIERANDDIQAIMVVWMSDNNTQDWTVGLKFVQKQKNCVYPAERGRGDPRHIPWSCGPSG